MKDGQLPSIDDQFVFESGEGIYYGLLTVLRTISVHREGFPFQSAVVVRIEPPAVISSQTYDVAVLFPWGNSETVNTHGFYCHAGLGLPLGKRQFDDVDVDYDSLYYLDRGTIWPVNSKTIKLIQT